MKESLFRQGYLLGVSHRCSSVADAVTGDYDFVVLVSSWDKRCIEVTKCDSLHGKYGILILFDTKDDQGLREAHDNALSAYVASRCQDATPVGGDSVDLEAVWSKIQAELTSARNEIGRPLRIFIDLCACPRFYALAILAFCFKQNIAERISVFYAEAKYPEEEDDGSRHEVFTVGGWTAVNVPGMEGSWEPGHRLFYLVSVGFEGAKTLRLVSRLEPDRVSILFPYPGAREDYPQRTREQNQQLINRFQIPESQIVNANAGDAIAAWSALQALSVERPEEENVNYVCCGTKPHSLALGLRSLALSYPSVLYIVPDRHKVVAIEASGVYWRYDISDVTVLGLTAR